MDRSAAVAFAGGFVTVSHRSAVETPSSATGIVAVRVRAMRARGKLRRALERLEKSSRLESANQTERREK